MGKKKYETVIDDTHLPPVKLPIAQPALAAFRCCYCQREYVTAGGLGSHLIRHHAGKKIPRWDDVALTMSWSEAYQAFKALRDAGEPDA